MGSRHSKQANGKFAFCSKEKLAALVLKQSAAPQASCPIVRLSLPTGAGQHDSQSGGGVGGGFHSHSVKSLDAYFKDAVARQQCGICPELADAIFSDTNEPIFTKEEVAMLNTSFEQMKQNRDQVAMELLEIILPQVGTPDKLESFNTAHNKIGSRWASSNLGIILLSGIERCLLRVDKPQHLRDLIRRIKSVHRDHYNTNGDSMAMLIQSCEPKLFSQLQRYSYHHYADDSTIIETAAAINDDDTSNNVSCCRCSVCKSWQKFFTVITFLLSSPSTDG